MIRSFNFAVDNGSLSISQRRGTITLIAKANKHTTVLDNLRPTSLLNTNYKILTKVVTKRLEKVLPKVLYPEQTGYIKETVYRWKHPFNFQHYDVHRREKHSWNRSFYRF